jgi:transcriptional regulator with XRE-family HTH domain
MDLRTYRAAHNLTQAAIAERLTAAGYPASQALVSQWERGELAMSADWCVRIERISEGECTRLDNRPDLFGDIKEAA